MKKIFQIEFILVFLFIATNIIIRSIHFSSALNFSTDQGLFSSKSLDIYRSKKLLLIGPTFSININGRYAFQGSVIYYFQMLFLLIGSFDPVKGSYAFMVFAALMTAPLYLGMRNLTNKRTAILMVIIFTFFPFYINYTRFLWNPNFQFALLPILIFFMGLYKKTEKRRYLFIISVLSGIIVQFHYQFLLIILLLIIYYMAIAKQRILHLMILISGILIGFSPIILFELRHDYYNLKTIILFFTNKSSSGGSFLDSIQDYYFLNISFAGFFILALITRKIRFPIVPIFLVFLIIALVSIIPEPAHGFRMVEKWNYLDEARTHQIIMGEHLTNFNIANLVYDTKASTQKYLLQKDNITINFEDYYTNKYLFIMSKDDKYLEGMPYEVNMFKPSRILKQWKINKYFNLYLVERI